MLLALFACGQGETISIVARLDHAESGVGSTHALKPTEGEAIPLISLHILNLDDCYSIIQRN